MLLLKWIIYEQIKVTSFRSGSVSLPMSHEKRINQSIAHCIPRPAEGVEPKVKTPQ